jgi:hypothetical protein
MVPYGSQTRGYYTQICQEFPPVMFQVKRLLPLAQLMRFSRTKHQAKEEKRGTIDFEMALVQSWVSVLLPCFYMEFNGSSAVLRFVLLSLFGPLLNS